MPVEPDKAHVCISGTDYVSRVDPQSHSSLQVGQRVLCNEAFAIVQVWVLIATDPSFAWTRCCRMGACALARNQD